MDESQKYFAMYKKPAVKIMYYMIPFLWNLEPAKLLYDDRIQKVVTHEDGKNWLERGMRSPSWVMECSRSC